jgi:hypothetical protein
VPAAKRAWPCSPPAIDTLAMPLYPGDYAEVITVRGIEIAHQLRFCKYLLHSVTH